MSLLKKNFNNSAGTTSRTYQIGKNRLTVDNEVDGSLRFTFYDSNGDPTEWKLDSDTNSIIFPDGAAITVQRIITLEEKVSTLEDKVTALENA